MPITINDDYDRRAYEQLLSDLNKGPSIASRASGRVGHAVGTVAKRAMKPLPTAVTDRAEHVIRGALGGLRALTLDPALRSVSQDRVARAFRRAGHSVDTADDIRQLPLRTIDEVMPSLRWRYSLGIALDGAGVAVEIQQAALLRHHSDRLPRERVAGVNHPPVEHMIVVAEAFELLDRFVEAGDPCVDR